MTHQDIKPYIIHLSTFRVVICRLCEICIPPKDPFEHYKRHHSAKKEHYVPMEIRRKIVEYMTTLDLCEPQEVRALDRRVSELKIIKDGFKCNFPGCGACVISEKSMRTHYYNHQKHIPKNFKNWDSTALQTFFDDQHRKYVKLFISALMVGTLRSDHSPLKMIKLVLTCWFNNSWTMLKREKLKHSVICMKYMTGTSSKNYRLGYVVLIG